MAQSLLASDGARVPFFRKKRTILALIAGLITLFFFLRPSSHPKSVQFGELHGLLYMVSNTEHVLPLDLDTSAPVPPSTYVPRETFNQLLWRDRIERLGKDTPLIVFSKSYCPYSRRAKELLDRYDLKPTPHIVEVDLRDDGNAIKSLLIRLTNRFTFPNVILQGKTLGGYDNLHALHETGELAHELERAGIRVSGDVHGE